MKETAQRKEILKNTGSKATPSRLRILEILEKSAKPISIDDVLAKTKKEMNHSTIYRILEAFKDSGLVKKVELGQGKSYYELSERPHHHHLVCVSCEEVEDIDECGILSDTKKILKNAKNFATIQNHSLEFFGVCKGCSKK